MKIFNFLKRKSATPLSNAQLLEFFRFGGRARWFGHNYLNFATEGYIKNIIAFHCIKEISKAVADIPVLIKQDEKIINDPKLTQLLKRPNPTQGWKTFMQNAVMHKLISGNCYIHGNIVSTGRIMELNLLRPDHVTIQCNAYYQPYEYLYCFFGKVFHFPIDPVTQQSEVLHIKEPNPVDHLYGLSPLAPGSMPIDQHNESSEWNKSLLENSARPSGVLTMKDKSETAPAMTREQLEKLREQLDESLSGRKNAGKVPILNFDMSWQPMAFSPTDMDWLKGREACAREVCYALGFPPHLLGLPDSSTYNNMSEAKLAFYEETVIPTHQNYMEEISYFLNYHNNSKSKSQRYIEIVPDLDKVSALTPRREAARKTAREDVTAGILSINEARHEGGFEPVKGGDEINVPVGRLPLSFDPFSEDMSKSQYTAWLMKNGYNNIDAKKMASLAFDS